MSGFNFFFHAQNYLIAKPYKIGQSGFQPKATMETAARESVDCQRHGFLQLDEDWLQDIIDRAGNHQMVWGRYGYCNSCLYTYNLLDWLSAMMGS